MTRKTKMRAKVRLMGLAGVLGLCGCQGKRPDLGIVDGALTPCPDKPNCVLSTAADERHSIEPIALSGAGSEDFERLKKIVKGMPRVTVVVDEPHYLHAEFASRLMGFVDDLELYLEDGDRRAASPSANIRSAAIRSAAIRSAARLGLSDMGVNRRRVEEIRTLFLQSSATGS